MNVARTDGLPPLPALPRGGPQDPVEAELTKLRAQAKQMESMFYSLVMKSMRETVKPAAYFDGGFAENVWTQVLDTELSEAAARNSPGTSLSDALYREFEDNVRAKYGRLGPQ